jgi:hypothetical protein
MMVSEWSVGVVEGVKWARGARERCSFFGKQIEAVGDLVLRILRMTELPSIPDLVRRTKALAALDLIMSPEWDTRYYSFNSKWSPHEQMASMRNGCGDEWWIVFHSDGWAALKGLGHESTAWSKGQEKLSAAIQAAFPSQLSGFASEPAFRWDETSFGHFFLPANRTWKSAIESTKFAKLKSGDEELFCHVVGQPEDYIRFAESYYERSLPLNEVRHIFDLKPITKRLVALINDEVSFASIEEELFNEIAYPQR